MAISLGENFSGRHFSQEDSLSRGYPLPLFCSYFFQWLLCPVHIFMVSIFIINSFLRGCFSQGALLLRLISWWVFLLNTVCFHEIFFRMKCASRVISPNRHFFLEVTSVSMGVSPQEVCSHYGPNCVL